MSGYPVSYRRGTDFPTCKGIYTGSKVPLFMCVTLTTISCFYQYQYRYRYGITTSLLLTLWCCCHNKYPDIKLCLIVQIVWDEATKSWKNTDPNAEDTSAPKLPPPKDSELPGGPAGPAMPQTPMATPAQHPGQGSNTPPMGSNRFSRQKTRGTFSSVKYANHYKKNISSVQCCTCSMKQARYMYMQSRFI